jgi:hypothetical protein
MEPMRRRLIAVDLHRLVLRFAPLRLPRAQALDALGRSIEHSGQLTPVVAVAESDQPWTHPETKTPPTWRERVLVARSSAYQAGLRRRRARTLARLTDDLTKLWQPPARGRKRYHSRPELERTIAERIATSGVSGVVQAGVCAETLPDGSTRWSVAAVGVNLAAWQPWWSGWAGRSTSPAPLRRTLRPRRW